MPPNTNSSHSDDASSSAQLQEQSLKNLSQGGLPLNAIDRLREQAAQLQNDNHGYSSTLSINEQLLMRNRGFQVLGQVMGCSVYQVGFQYIPSWSGSWMELTALTSAYYNARHLALHRMQQEAALLGATGIVGMQLTRRTIEEGVIEFLAFGTAIKELTSTYNMQQELPFVSALSGEDCWLLYQAGFRPVGFAFGCCVLYQVASWQTQLATSSGLFGTGWINQELTDFTQSLYQARELAMERMVREARAVQASGIIGSDIEMHHTFHPGDNNVPASVIHYFTAIGTAIAPIPPNPNPTDIQMVLTMKDADAP